MPLSCVYFHFPFFRFSFSFSTNSTTFRSFTRISFLHTLFLHPQGDFFLIYSFYVYECLAMSCAATSVCFVFKLSSLVIDREFLVTMEKATPKRRCQFSSKQNFDVVSKIHRDFFPITPITYILKEKQILVKRKRNNSVESKNTWFMICLYLCSSTPLVLFVVVDVFLSFSTINKCCRRKAESEKVQSWTFDCARIHNKFSISSRYQHNQSQGTRNL